MPDGDLVFLAEVHLKYIKNISTDTTSFEYAVSQHLRMSGVYWGMTAMALLGSDLAADMQSEEIVDWVQRCQHDSGGYGGNVDHDPHMLYTLSALQILAVCDRMDLVNKELVLQFVASLQNDDGSFNGDVWGEVDTRFSYCALSILAILDSLNTGVINLPKAIDFVARCKNFDGNMHL